MAKKKTSLPMPTIPDRVQISVINLKGTEEERDWLTLANKRTHYPKSTIIRLALRDWAAAKGLPPYPLIADSDA
jgi:hypothetical protein